MPITNKRPSSSEQSPDRKIEDEHYALLFGVRRSMRYHLHLREYFERQHNVASIVTLLYGTTAFLGVISEWLTQEQAVLVMVVVSILLTRDLILQTSRRTWEHAGLRRRFGALEQAMVRKKPEQYTADELAELKIERLRIEDDEPPPKRALDLICHNELVASMFEPTEAAKHMYAVPWYMRVTAQSVSWNVNSVQK